MNSRHGIAGQRIPAGYPMATGRGNIRAGIIGELFGLLNTLRAMLAEGRGVSVASWDNGTKCDRRKILQRSLQ
jgi:hypothetical protein